MSAKRRLVYSTGPGGATSSKKGGKDGGAPTEPSASVEPARQAPRVRRERAGRKGKTVTVIEPVVLARDDAAALLKDLKKACGGGGTLKAGRRSDGAACFVLELQGDHADDVVAWLCERGYRAKRSGG